MALDSWIKISNQDHWYNLDTVKRIEKMGGNQMRLHFTDGGQAVHPQDVVYHGKKYNMFRLFEFIDIILQAEGKIIDAIEAEVA
jgi:hypothetical protein